ncbi:hypothetical protein PR048_024050 [Dryococelus australis]|uniref:Uncharacterized protein n=1 Tax=Dryococelus australis TaxID=614101 RepID=A0ABQ9GVW9_9NEOP|nr:hypothetical protein PR048_024050 [Dryococelus australis]
MTVSPLVKLGAPDLVKYASWRLEAVQRSPGAGRSDASARKPVTSRRHGATVAALLTSHQGEPGSTSGRVAGFLQVAIVPVDAVVRSVFLGDLTFPQPLHSGAVPYSLQSPASALKTSLLRAAHISSLTRSRPVSLLTSQIGDPGSIPGRFAPDFRMWESCRTMPLVGGFSRGSPVSPALSFRRCYILTSIILIGSQELDRSRWLRTTRLRVPTLNCFCQYDLQIPARIGFERVCLSGWLQEDTRRVSSVQSERRGVSRGHQDEKSRERSATNPRPVTGFSQTGIVTDYAVGQRVFFGDLPFTPPLHSGAVPYSLPSPSSAPKTWMLRAAQISSLIRSKYEKEKRLVTTGPRKPMTAKRGECGAAPECKGGGNRRSSRKPANQRPSVRHDSHLRKSGGNLPRIEPGLPWWEASSLTSRPPWPPRIYRIAAALITSDAAASWDLFCLAALTNPIREEVDWITEEKHQLL